MNAWKTFLKVLPLAPDVAEAIGVTVDAIIKRDPDLAAQYARRAALKQTFDFTQKAKRKEL